MFLKSKIIFLFFYCCTLINNVGAVSLEKLNIKSDSLTIEKKKSTATFTGSVKVIIGDFKLITSKLTIAYSDINSNNHKEIKNIIVPHKLKAIKSNTNEIITADKAIFDNLTKELILEGNVYLQKEDNILVTNKLIYSSSLEKINYKL